MGLLDKERSALDTFMPGLDEFLSSTPLMELEGPHGKGIAAFRDHGGAALLVPAEHSGRGASALEAVRVQRAIGSRSPSLAVATTMHHFSVASLVALSEVSHGMEWMMLEGIATNHLLVASGFSEGRPGGGILQPSMEATQTAEGVRISGVKRPCSLARSMGLLTASVRVPRLDGNGTQLAVALIPAASDGIEVTPFWSSFALAGAEVGAHHQQLEPQEPGGLHVVEQLAVLQLGADQQLGGDEDVRDADLVALGARQCEGAPERRDRDAVACGRDQGDRELRAVAVQPGHPDAGGQQVHRPGE